MIQHKLALFADGILLFLEHPMVSIPALLNSLNHRFPNWGTRTPRGMRSGSGGMRGENFRDNRKRTEFAEWNVWNRIANFRRKHNFVHQNRPNSAVFCPARLYFFLKNTTTIATMNKHWGGGGGVRERG